VLGYPACRRPQPGADARKALRRAETPLVASFVRGAVGQVGGAENDRLEGLKSGLKAGCTKRGPCLETIETSSTT